MARERKCFVTYLLSFMPLVGCAQVLPHYTAQGNLDQQGVNTQLVYNPGNQLIETPRSQYAYFANGLLASETADQHLFYYYLDRSGKRRNASDGTHFASYLLGYRALMRSISGHPQALYLTNMHLSIIGKIAANDVQMQQYGPYGQSLIKPHSVAFAMCTDPLGYASYPVDPVTHWYYLQARFYVPALGQFSSRDTFNLANRYFYANNNPAMMIDPKGHAAQSTQSWPWQAYPIVGGGVFLGALSVAGIAGVKYAMKQSSRVASYTSVSTEFSDTESDSSSGSMSSEDDSRGSSPVSGSFDDLDSDVLKNTAVVSSPFHDHGVVIMRAKVQLDRKPVLAEEKGELERQICLEKLGQHDVFIWGAPGKQFKYTSDAFRMSTDNKEINGILVERTSNRLQGTIQVKLLSQQEDNLVPMRKQDLSGKMEPNDKSILWVQHEAQARALEGKGFWYENLPST